MNDPDWYAVLAGMVALGTVMAGGIAIVEEGSAARPAVSSASAPSADHLYLTVAFNPVSGIDQFFPANFTVPSHARVIVSITNYDTGMNSVPAAAATVTGTVGGTETAFYGSPPTHLTVRGISPSSLAHTFTITALGLNAPIPSAPSPTTPSVTTFELFFTQPGRYAWMCQAPCDPMAMMMVGYMSGTLTIE